MTPHERRKEMMPMAAGYTVREAADRLNRMVLQGHGEDELAVMLERSSVGGSAKSAIKSFQHGFDWDTGTTFIEPAEPLIEAAKDRDNPMEAEMCIPMTDRDKRFFMKCPACGAHMTAKDESSGVAVRIKATYCFECGQRLSALQNEEGADA